MGKKWELLAQYVRTLIRAIKIIRIQHYAALCHLTCPGPYGCYTGAKDSFKRQALPIPILLFAVLLKRQTDLCLPPPTPSLSAPSLPLSLPFSAPFISYYNKTPHVICLHGVSGSHLLWTLTHCGVDPPTINYYEESL